VYLEILRGEKEGRRSRKSRDGRMSKKERGLRKRRRSRREKEGVKREELETRSYVYLS
jgi:hypothetical protein